MEDMTDEAEPSRKRDFAHLLNRLERTYLAVLRTGALIVATLLLVYAAWLAASGLYKISRDAKSVKEAAANVTPEEVTSVDLNSLRDAGNKEAADPFKRERTYYQGFAKRYLALYRGKFEPYLQKGDAKANEASFGSQYIDLDNRLEGIKQGDLDFEKDKSDLETLLKVMADASDAKVTKDRLNAYKSAKKTEVSKTVSGTKSERYCSYYGYYIDQCISWASRQVPVKRTVTETRLPNGVVEPAKLFAAYHDKYITTLVDHRTRNAAEARRARAEIVEDNAAGADSLWTAIRVIGSFVVLMFLFLLIALERHQRWLARDRGGDQDHPVAQNE